MLDIIIDIFIRHFLHQNIMESKSLNIIQTIIAQQKKIHLRTNDKFKFLKIYYFDYFITFKNKMVKHRILCPPNR